MSRPDRETEALVRSRAGGRCEYCHLPERFTDTPFQFDHIIAEKHGGQTAPENLAYACFYCNTYKGPNVAGVDPQGGRILRLFNPRSNGWARHFRWDGPFLRGLTGIGRVTIEVLRINDPAAVVARTSLLAEGIVHLE